MRQARGGAWKPSLICGSFLTLHIHFVYKATSRILRIQNGSHSSVAVSRSWFGKLRSWFKSFCHIKYFPIALWQFLCLQPLRFHYGSTQIRPESNTSKPTERTRFASIMTTLQTIVMFFNASTF